MNSYFIVLGGYMQQYQLQFLGGKCRICGLTCEDDHSITGIPVYGVFHLHHLSNKDKKYRAYLRAKRFNGKNVAELMKGVVLCSRCHTRLTDQENYYGFRGAKLMFHHKELAWSTNILSMFVDQASSKAYLFAEDERFFAWDWFDIVINGQRQPVVNGTNMGTYLDAINLYSVGHLEIYKRNVPLLEVDSRGDDTVIGIHNGCNFFDFDVPYKIVKGSLVPDMNGNLWGYYRRGKLLVGNRIVNGPSLYLTICH